MGRPNRDQKYRVIRLHEKGINFAKISNILAEEKISLDASSVSRIVKHFKLTGSFTHHQKKRRFIKLTEDQYNYLGTYFSNPDNWRSNKDIYRKMRNEMKLDVHYTSFLRAKHTFDYFSGPIRFVPLIRFVHHYTYMYMYFGHNRLTI